MSRLVVTCLMTLLYASTLWGACGANTRTWEADSGTSNWNTNNNWNPANRPNTAGENAVIISDWFNPVWPNNNYTLGCLEIQSGTMSATNNRRVTLVGDYFRNLNPGSLIVGGGNTWEVVMQGTGDQTFENVDLIPRLRINNANTVTLTESFSIRDRFLIDAGSGFVVIEGDLETQQTGAFTIEAGVNVQLSTGASWTLNGDLNVNGILDMSPGSRLIFADGSTLTVSAGGALDINGTPGNAVTIDAEDVSSTFTLTINGNLDAQYLVLDHMGATGIQMNGTVSRFDDVSLYSIPSGGSGMTLGAAANLPADMNGVGFFDNGTGGPFTNVNAAAYSGSIVEFVSWAGIGDTANENDPNNVINWGTEATPTLQIQNLSGAGVPPATIAKGSALTEFATFAFSMSGTAAVATNVTNLTLTLDGSNINSDISGISVYDDTNGNCSYDGGTDTLIGSYTPTGIPGTIDVTLSGEINVIDTTQDCLHVRMSTASSATTGNTIGISIEATDDVTNDQGYDLSDTAGPPVNPGVATITGTAVLRWNGGYGTNMFDNRNWTPNGNPNNSTDCEVGNGYQPPRMTGAFNCLNTRFQNSGTINWNNTTNIFNVYGAWVVENGFNYQNSNNAIVNIRGAGDQSVTLDDTTFPNDVRINSGGVVTIEDSGTISGDVTVTTGTLRISTGASLRVDGDISVASGATFEIEPGGELILGNNSTLTINSGGTLDLVGSSVLSASVRAINDGSRYTITVNNGATIRAQYYALRNLGANGLTINASATIDPSFPLQNGTFTYPGINNANLLRLFQEVPGDVLDGMSFDSDGSGATGVISIFTSTGATADTLSMTNYSGNMTGASFTDDTNYLVTWDSETNEIMLTQEATAPASTNQGDVVDMGTFGFEQLNAGAFNDTDLTSIRITLIGTGDASDVDSVTLYYDAGCSGSGGTSLGSQSFSGNPARAIFSGLSGVTVEADGANPPLRCINVEYNINSLASDGKTVGAEISLSTHVVNSEGYEFNASFAPAVNLGTTSIVGVTTQWTGATSTNWFTAGNWSSGVPNANLNCVINNQANDPVIGGGTATCKSMDIGNGILTHNAGTLEIYGSLESTGTINSSAPIVIRDNGATPTSQSIDVTSTLDELQFNKTAGGTVNIISDVTVTTAMSVSGAQNFTMNVTANNTLRLDGGLTLSGAVLDMQGGSQLQIGAGQTLLVNGGTFRTSGTNDAYPQTLSNKAHITNTGGASTWAFSATSGTVDLTGFYIDWLNTSGLNLSGSASLSNLNGGQLRNLPNSAGMRAIQLNTSGSIPATSSNFGWNWGPTNSPPAEGTSYFLGYSSGCSSQTIDFDQWFGDFWPFTTATTNDKISAASCTILIDRAKSPVSLTHLSATPYDQKVVVEWTTGSEWNHRGFNIYRSLNPDSSYVQINNSMIQNDLFSTTIHGTYAFVDSGVENDKDYYYYIEDVSLLGERTLHGPLQATPSASLGDPPMIEAGTIAHSSQQEGGGESDDSGGDTIEISENVWVLSQTDHYMRLKIVIPAMTQAPDPLNTSFTEIGIEGYTPILEAGHPEVLNKTILIPVSETTGSVSGEIVETLHTAFSGFALTAAPEYVPAGDTFNEQWTQDAAAYALNQQSPASFIELENVVENEGSHFLPLTIHAVSYNPVTQDLVKADELIVDLHLNGAAPWETNDPERSPWMREGSIKLGFLAEGMHRVTFEELRAAGVVAPVEDADINHLHVRVASVDIGLQVDSVDSAFNAGDSLLFYVPHFDTDESLYTYAVLYVDDSQPASLATTEDVSVGSEPPTDRYGFWTKNTYEENNLAVFNEPFTEDSDHFVWSLIYGISGGAQSGLEFDINLPHLSPEGVVTVKVLAKSRTANSVNTHHNLQLFANEYPQPIGEASFEAVESKWIRFQVPASQFVSGLNQLKLYATGNNLTAGEYDMLYVDRVVVYHHQDWAVDDDQALLLDLTPEATYNVSGFTTNNILAFDVSNPTQLFELNNFNVQADGDGYAMNFALSGSALRNRIWVGEADKIGSAQTFKLVSGSHWQDSNHEADIVFIGHKDLLGTVKPLVDYRESQGYKVHRVDLESIYNEFGNGLHNVSSIKDFVAATRDWKLVPRYFVLLGDGTYDPKAYQNPFMKYRFPVKYIKGASYDYVSDHWFVADDAGIPQAIIGRIPAHSQVELSQYVTKVLNFENGMTKPAATDPIHLISDHAQYAGEDFAGALEDIKSVEGMSGVANAIVHTQREGLSDSAMKQAIENSFSNSSIVHYMGHGAENIWADDAVFNNADAESLNNPTLPVVVAMNCLNAQYSDPGLDSFAEKLLFNPNGGAILFWGSTSLTPPSIQSIYQESFYQQLANHEDASVGSLVKLAKTQSGLDSPYDEALYSWSIIGDPLVRPQITLAETDSPVRQPAADSGSSGGGSGGCAAFASDRLASRGGSFDLFLGFLLEVLLLLGFLRWIGRFGKNEMR